MRDRLFSVRFALSTCKVSITAYDRGHCYLGGRTKIYYQLSVDGRVLFPGDGSFYGGVGMGHTDDGPESKENAVAFFCLKPGDTDADFFADYTPEQLAWVTANGEELSMLKEERWGTP